MKVSQSSVRTAKRSYPKSSFTQTLEGSSQPLKLVMPKACTPCHLAQRQAPCVLYNSSVADSLHLSTG